MAVIPPFPFIVPVKDQVRRRTANRHVKRGTGACGEKGFGKGRLGNGDKCETERVGEWWTVMIGVRSVQSA